MSDTAQERAAIERLIARLVESWNRHDAEGFAREFDADADFVNVVGMHFHGRPAITEIHRQIHQTFMRATTLRLVKSATRFLAPGVGLAHVHWAMTGMAPVPGWNTPAEREGVLSLVLVGGGDAWSIASAQNTDVVPVQLPAGGPQAAA